MYNNNSYGAKITSCKPAFKKTDTALIKVCKEIQRHDRIINCWKQMDSQDMNYLEAKAILDTHKNKSINQLQETECARLLNFSMESCYNNYFQIKCNNTPEGVINGWLNLVRTFECVIPKGYTFKGYRVFFNPNTDKSKCNTNYLNIGNHILSNKYTNLYSKEIIANMMLKPIENLAKEITGCVITIADKESKYYDS